MNAAESLQHWIHHGCRECRIGDHIDKSLFNLEYYKKQNTDVSSVIEKDTDFLQHWYKHGKHEMRVCYEKQGFLTQTVSVLSRTSNRPNYFAQCRESVIVQTYPFVEHFISYDNQTDKHYLTHLPNTIYIPKSQTTNYKESFSPNNYINIIAKQIPKPSWVIVLDDDDIFCTPRAIEIIMNSVSLEDMQTDTPSLYIWQTKMSESHDLPDFSGNDIIRSGNIASCCFMFHSHYLDSVPWKPQRKGDLVFLQDLIKAFSPSIIRIPAILTQLQDDPGFGQKKGIVPKNKSTFESEILTHSIELIDLYNLSFSPFHSYINPNMKNITCWILSLERRQDKRESLLIRLDKKWPSLSYEIFTAEDGQDVKYVDLYEKHAEKNKTVSKKIPSSGSLAILHSMKRMILEAKKRKLEYFLVLQDDIYLCDHFEKKMNAFLGCFSNMDWKLLYLGCTQHVWAEKMHILMINNDVGFYFPNGTADGAFSMFIHSSIYDELLVECDKQTLPFDSGPLKTLQKKYPGQCICASPYLIIADVRDSDCRPPRNQRRFSQKCKWDLSQFPEILT